MSLGNELYAKYALQTAAASNAMSLPETVAHGAVAALGEFGASVWNSLTPESVNTTTEDLLSRIDSDALQVYNEHPDAIHAASFIGGAFVPMGLALKGLNTYRSGSKSVNWLTKAGETSQLKKVEDAFNLAGANSKVLREASNKLYRNSIYNAAADSIAAEAAIVLTMNAHPWMEDYMKDAGENFVFWAAVGTGVGGAIGLIQARGLTKALTHGLEKEEKRVIFEGARPVDKALYTGEQLRNAKLNIDNWESTLQKADKGQIDISQSLRDTLNAVVLREKANISTSYKEIVTGPLKDAPQELIKAHTDLISTSPNLTGVDKVAFYKSPSMVRKVTGELVEVTDEPLGFIKTVLNKEGKGVLRAEAMVVHPQFNNRTSSVVEAANFAPLAATGKTIENIIEESKKVNLRYSDQDRILELAVLPTAKIQELFAVEMRAIESLDVEALSKVATAATDLTRMKALSSKVSTLPIEERIKFKSKEFQNSDELIAKTKDLNLKTIKELLKAGQAPETVALRTATPLDEVLKVMTGASEPTNIYQFRTTDDIIRELDPRNRPIVVSSSIKKFVNQATINSNQQIKKADDISRQLTDYYLASSKSSLVQDLGKFFDSDTTRIQSELMSREISSVTSSGLYSMFFTSINRSLEKWGIVGKIASSIGNDVTTIGNRITKEFINPIASQSAKIIKNQDQMIETNIAINHNASLSGWRMYEKETGRILQKEKTLLNGKEVEVLVPSKLNGVEFAIKDPEVQKLFELYQIAGREMYELKNLKPKVLGKAAINDIGFWVPAFNPRDREIAYVFNKETQEISLLHARTVGELNDLVAQQRKNLVDRGTTHLDIVTKGKEQQWYNELAGRHDPMYMSIADVTLQHGGASTSTLVKTNYEPMTDIVNSYEHYLLAGIDDVIELKFQPVMDKLKVISDLSQIGFEKGTLGVIGQLTKTQVDPGQVLRNVILGKPNLGQYKAWQEYQQRGQAGVEIVMREISELFAPAIPGFLGKKGKDRTEESWKALNKTLEEKGYAPFRGLDEFERYKREGSVRGEAPLPRIVALSNGLAATMILKFLEVAQPLVNITSLPILTSGAISRKLEASFMDGVLDPAAKFSIHETMFDGIRLLNHPTEGPRIAALAMEKNLFANLVSEADSTLRGLRSLEDSAVAKAESLLQSKFFKTTGGLADYSETLVRKTTFFTGFAMAKKAYPGISDLGAMTFARNFMDEAIGNYAAAQRATAFQGTIGVAMGLFQTYFLTLAQSMYRQIEAKDWVALSKMMLTQTGIFGASSLPGFTHVSKAIGESFSDNHYDLESGTFRVLPTEAGNIGLYGLMSSFGPGITTRGDINPRISTPVTLENVPIANLAVQSYEAGERLVKAAFTADRNTGRAMLEALALQSINRPIARISEIVSGTAITGAGKIVSTQEEIWTAMGITARLMSTRPLEEIKARQAIHLDSYYRSEETDKRKEVIKSLRTMIRDGDLDPDKVQELQFEYMRYGSPSGWRAIIREALMETQQKGLTSVKERLAPDAPWNRMIDDLD